MFKLYNREDEDNLKDVIMTTEIIFQAEFDNFPDKKYKIEVRRLPDYDLQLVLCTETETVLLTATRDQWGAYLDLGGKALISQEDHTRSFLSALITGLGVMKDHMDGDTLEPTVTLIED